MNLLAEFSELCLLLTGIFLFSSEVIINLFPLFREEISGQKYVSFFTPRSNLFSL